MRKEQLCDCEILHKDIVEKVLNQIESEQTLTKISCFYKAFADITRIKIINMLDCNEMCVCDISVLLNMTKSAVSHQLTYLKKLNIVKSRRQGKQVFYSLDDEHVKQVFEKGKEHVLEKIYE